jgi:hypothetical protein
MPPAESTDDAPELPAPVREALRAGRKIEAIRLLREDRSLSLNEAVAAIRASAREDGSRPARRPSRSDDRIGSVVRALLAAAIAYGAYVLLT